MKANTISEREQVIRLALSARTAEEIELAVIKLNNWCEANPNDDAIRDAYEPLILRREMLIATPQELALTN